MRRSLNELMGIYVGSDGDATQDLYEQLKTLGPEGFIAMNLFRAQKNSSRAKDYRGSRYRLDAYERKEWSIKNLAESLDGVAAGLGLNWGWAVDSNQNMHKWVFYVDLPTGQVSFHTRSRGLGPMYLGVWDGERDRAPTRICKWIVMLLDAEYSRPRAALGGFDASA